MKKIFSKIITAIFAIFISIAIFSCDEIKNPLKEKTGTCGDETLPTPIKKILVEDYTGHTCGNCPRAAEQMHELIDTYCDYIIPVSIHAGYFALPQEAAGFPEDFRTDEGTILDNFFGNSNAGLPNGMVNRTKFDGNTILPHSTWAAAIEEQLLKKPEANLIVKNEYNPSTFEYTSTIDIEILQNINGNFNLSVFIIEDSIIAPQKDYDADPTHIDDYVHMHMLRKSLNGAWGDKIIEGQANFEDVITQKYVFTLPENFVVKNCSIICFIYNNETKEIVQAESEKINQ